MCICYGCVHVEYTFTYYGAIFKQFPAFELSDLQWVQYFLQFSELSDLQWVQYFTNIYILCKILFFLQTILSYATNKDNKKICIFISLFTPGKLPIQFFAELLLGSVSCFRIPKRLLKSRTNPRRPPCWPSGPSCRCRRPSNLR